MSAPERTALKKTKGYEANWYGVVTDATDEDPSTAEYIRLDLHEAAVSAARAEGMRAGMIKAASIAANACLVEPDGGNPTKDERLVCEEAYRRIIAAAEASK